MTTFMFVFIGAVVILLVGIILFGVIGSARKLRNFDDLQNRLEAVNTEALRNLLDPVQDSYLAQRLTPGQLRSVRRERSIVAIEYVWKIARNAALIMSAAELASRSPSQDVAASAVRIANAALRTRFLALQTVGHLALTVVLPGRPVGESVLRKYVDLDSDIHSLTLAKAHSTSNPTRIAG